MAREPGLGECIRYFANLERKMKKFWGEKKRSMEIVVSELWQQQRQLSRMGDWLRLLYLLKEVFWQGLGTRKSLISNQLLIDRPAEEILE